MQLFYTSVDNNLTQLLTEKANQLIAKNKQIFYIAPNSLSFEKERQVLDYLPNHATFQMMVTRFNQLPNYFILPKQEYDIQLDDHGLSMLLFKILNELPDDSIPVFGRLRKDAGFIQKLLDLYKDLSKAHLDLTDLDIIKTKEDKSDKVKELQLILETFVNALTSDLRVQQSKLQFFMEVMVNSTKLDDQLKDKIFIIDGFTRFSAEEEKLITLLHDKSEDVIIGCYASDKAYQTSFLEGNIYEASVEFLRTLAKQFKVKPIMLEASNPKTPFTKISKAVESYYDFSESVNKPKWTKRDKNAIQVWEASNQKMEIEAIAKDIRRKIREEGADYKDFLVLLGDRDTYQLPLERLFHLFEIPYYLGWSRSMINHPLAAFMINLKRVLHYKYQLEDVINLLKTGLYSDINQVDIDVFEQYCRYADISASKFNKPFKNNISQTIKVEEDDEKIIYKYSLDYLNQLRKQLISPLSHLKQSGSINTLLNHLMAFFDEISLTKNVQAMIQQAPTAEKEEHEEVWKCFINLLEQSNVVFEDQELQMVDLITLLADGMKNTDYRTVPATVNVVNVKSYELIEPHSSPYVYAIGLTQDHFPKMVQNNSLLSDEERQLINENTKNKGHFDIVVGDQLKKSHFIAISLLNAAGKNLVLSYPLLSGEGQNNISPYLKLLVNHIGLPLVTKEKKIYDIDPDDLGTYKEVLTRIISLNRSPFLEHLSQEEVTYWSVLGRVIRKQLKEEGVSIPHLNTAIGTRTISKDVIDILFPKEQEIILSASSLTQFFNNQYLYFINNILKLRELDTIYPDARSHGNFLHKVFERVFSNAKDLTFQDKLKEALLKTESDKEFASIYNENQESLYSKEILESIAKSTASLFDKKTVTTVESQEASFKLDLGFIDENTSHHPLKVRGFIDRIDILRDQKETPLAFGVVDYKSSRQQFQLEAFYNGLSPQLLTYLLALKEGQIRKGNFSNHQLDSFGAMYLEMIEPTVALKEVTDQSKIISKLQDQLRYDGLFSEKFVALLPTEDYKFSRNKQAVVYNEEEMALLLGYLKQQYQYAASRILSGHFEVNPYTKDGETVNGDQLTALTGFEADLHLPQARKLKQIKANNAEKRQLLLDSMRRDSNDKGDM